MVKSGLEESIMTTPGAVPRVSQYRLAAHLGTALLLFMGMLGTGLTIRREWNWASYVANGKAEAARAFETALANPVVRRFHRASKLLTGLVFLTAISGAFVAGLDAGLVYNEFPYMGGRLAPPLAEMFSAAYAKLPDGSDAWWRNLLENPTTVQFDHRLLAITTYFSTTALYLSTFLPAVRSVLPVAARRLTGLAFLTANLQVTLGISTLLMLVPVPLAAAHQAGSVALLTVMVALWGSLKNPGRAARLWREAGIKLQAKRPST
jgi:cytochrome c oxidase assembly protein subunit 15